MGLILSIVGGLAVVAVGVTVAVMLAGRAPGHQPAQTAAEPTPAGRFDWIDVTELVIEDELARGTESRWVPFRPRREFWTESDADEHWIDPRQIGLDVLEVRVKENIRLMLEDAQ